MSTYVRTDKCDGCTGQEKTTGMYICPHDLMLLDLDGSKTGHPMKAYNQEPEQRWECYSCVKICPQYATAVRPCAHATAGASTPNSPRSNSSSRRRTDTSPPVRRCTGRRVALLLSSPRWPTAATARCSSVWLISIPSNTVLAVRYTMTCSN